VVFNILYFQHDCISQNLHILSDLIDEIPIVANALSLNNGLGLFKDVWISNQRVTMEKELHLLLLFSNGREFGEECLNMILLR